MAAAYDEYADRLARRIIGRTGIVQYLRAHRIAGMGGVDTGGKRRGPRATGDLIDVAGEASVDAAQHTVLFVDHPRNT